MAKEAIRWHVWAWRLHAWVGRFSALGVLMWGVSGLMHPLMHRLSTKPAALKAVFRAGHQWVFLNGLGQGRTIIMALVLACVLISAVSGLCLFMRLRMSAQRRHAVRPLSAWHRRLGMMACVLLVGFSVSGFVHLMKHEPHERPAGEAQPSHDTIDRWIFVNVHKWHWLNGNKDVRDGLQSLAMVAVLSVAGSGLALSVRRSVR